MNMSIKTNSQLDAAVGFYIVVGTFHKAAVGTIHKAVGTIF
jgi:hypothetical protein